MRLHLLLQTGFEARPNETEGNRNSFVMERARLTIDGHFLNENLTYLLSAEAMNGFGAYPRSDSPGAEVLPSSDQPDIPVLLDARLNWSIPELGLTFAIGRFVPCWGLLMGESPADLGAVNYPLYIEGSQGSFGVFRSVGIEAEIELNRSLQVGGGVFNGGKNAWLDDNDRKDMLVYFTFKPLPGLAIRASSLFAFPEVKDGLTEDGTPIENGFETQIVPILEARYRDFGLDLIAGGAIGTFIRHEDDMRKDYFAGGFLFHAGYVLLGDWFELIARIEWWEPSSEVADDEQLRITAGPQILIAGLHAALNINYVQDFYSSALAMCENYLKSTTCTEGSLIAEAQKQAATLLVQFSLSL